MCIQGKTAWNLYLGCGLTRENIEDLCGQKSIQKIDWEGFEEELKQFQEKSQSGSSSSVKNYLIDLKPHVDVLRKRSVTSTEQSKLYQNVYEMPSDVVYSADAGSNRSVVVLRESCFYPESGGQTSDIGTITTEDGSREFSVIHVVKIGEHVLHLIEGPASSTGLCCGDKVVLRVDQARREHCAWHHTACHLLNAAVREQLGEGAQQNSSLVDDRHFRLDIVSRTSVDVSHIEEFINTAIHADLRVQTDEVVRGEVIGDPRVVKVPGEIYPERVRLVRCGNISSELCCGTHVSRTSEIPSVVVLSSRSLGVNLKSVTATATQAAEAVENAHRISAKVCALQKYVASLTCEKYPKLIECRQQMRSLKQEIAAEPLLPHLTTIDAEEKLHHIDRNIEQLIRNNSKLFEEKVSTLVSELPQERPLIGCIALDCDISVLSKILRQRRDLDKTLSYFVALRSSENVYVELFVPPQNEATGQSATGWLKSFIEALGSDSKFCKRIGSAKGKRSKKENQPPLIRLRIHAPLLKEKIEVAAKQYMLKNMSTKQPL